MNNIERRVNIFKKETLNSYFREYNKGKISIAIQFQRTFFFRPENLKSQALQQNENII